MAEENLGIVSDSGMPRVCVRIPRAQRKEIEQLVERGDFPNTSEAIRSAIRKQVSEQTERVRSNQL